MLRFIPLIFIALIGFVACENGEAKPELSKRDTSINLSNSVTVLFFDSTRMEAFIAKEKPGDSIALAMRSFYNERNYQMAWFDTTGLTEHALSFLQAQQQYISYSRDSSIYDQRLQVLSDILESDSTDVPIDSSLRLSTELLLTCSFFRYAQAAYEGQSSLNLKDLGWYIPRKKIDLRQLLDSIFVSGSAKLSEYDPVNRQYRRLKKHLLEYYELEKNYSWEPLQAPKTSLKPGDNSELVPTIRERLVALGDLATSDSSLTIDDTLTLAIKRFQRRHGLSEDGVMGAGFFAQLNISPAQRIRQLLVNMERLRWVPAANPKDYLLINIPAYQLFIYRNDSLDWSMDVVVGSTAHNTVIFRGDLKYIVFSPYWNVPKSIVRNEIEPALKKNSNYLEKNNMERYTGGIRQKPGPNNSLGLVKFLFPNNYNIYLHDTPAKSLFGRDQRAFSHGCIRLAEARKLAYYLLRDNPKWTPENIDKAMAGKKETWVTLPQTLPVFIGYFTAWESSEGLLQFRNDVYGHDKKLADRLFQ